jgi:hypothetical protein
MAKRSGLQDVSKLPKWARNRITSLEGSVSAAEEKIDELLGGDGDPARGLPIVMEPHSDTPKRLPRGTAITFKLTESYEYMSPGVELRHSTTLVNGEHVPCLEVHATGGADVLVFEPMSGNMGNLRARKR